jgi:hypothetical protein
LQLPIYSCGGTRRPLAGCLRMPPPPCLLLEVLEYHPLLPLQWPVACSRWEDDSFSLVFVSLNKFGMENCRTAWVYWILFEFLIHTNKICLLDYEITKKSVDKVDLYILLQTSSALIFRNITLIRSTI